MSGSYSSGNSSSGATPRQIIENFTKYLPQLSQLSSDQISKFVSSISQSGLASAQGAGGQLASAVSGISNALNPSLATANQSASSASSAAQTGIDAATRGVNAINLNGLSPGEATSTERSLNQTNTGTGNLGLVNPTNTISNAMNFGGAFNSKLGLLNNAVGSLSGATGAAAGASNAGSNAAGANTASMAGVNAIANPAQLGVNASSGFTGQMGTMGAGTRSEASNSSTSGGVCGSCYIFVEVLKKNVPDCVRKARNKYYRLNPDIAAGYRRMSCWLVPMMRYSPLVTLLVQKVMIQPAAEFLAHPKKGWKKQLCHFWLRVWAVYGKGKIEDDYNAPCGYPHRLVEI